MKYYYKLLYYLLLIIIIAISFLFYSSNYYPLLNSDDALNILMAHYYKLPSDLYCWGQDRGGTLIPLISQFFIKIFKFSAITSVSLSNYLILILGYIGFSSLFKTKYSKLIFALIWFLPYERFIDILRFPIGVEYSLVGFAIFLINKLSLKDTFNIIKNNIILISIILTLIISIWVSDLAIVTIVILIFILLIFNYIENNKIRINNIVVLYFVFGLILYFLFINFAKSFAIIKTEHYLSVNNLDSIRKAIHLIRQSFIKILTFNNHEYLVSIYTYCVIIFLIIFSIFLLKKKLFVLLIYNKWFIFFIADFIAILLTLILSAWVLSNGMGRWYFVAPYISLSIAILIAIELLQFNNYNVLPFKIGLIIIVIIGSISPIYNMKFINPKTLRPMAQVVGELKQLGKIGIISEYWNSYISSCPNPEMIKATPNDQSDVRNQQLVDDVFSRKKIYVIKDMWMNSFPDTLEQFGYVLVKEGQNFNLASDNLCKYKKIKLHKYIKINKLTFKKGVILFDSNLQRNVLFVSSTCDSCKENFFVYGPFIPIGIGDFTIRFYMKSTNLKNDNPIAKIDVSVDWGKNILASRKITKTELNNNIYTNCDLNFNTTKRYNGVEFRIYYYGNADLFFDHLELIEK